MSQLTIFWRGILLAWMLALASPGAMAGSTAKGDAAQPVWPAQQVAAFAGRVELALAQQGARVAVVSRMGRPLAEMPPGMRYTHVAFAVANTPENGQQPDFTFHNLYQLDDQLDTSELVQDKAADFFAKVAVLEAGVIVPTPALQQRLLQLIASPAYVQLHDPRYSLIANPFNLGRQNCTEFVLDVITAALHQSNDIAHIKAREQSAFVAQPVHVNPFKLLLGWLFNREVSLVDQPGIPVTATFERLTEFMQRQDPGAQVLTILAD